MNFFFLFFRMGENTSSGFVKEKSCLPAQDNFVYLEKVPRIILESIFILLLVLGVLTNSLATYLTYKTRQWRNRSLRLIWFLCMNDMLSSFFSNIIYFVFLELYNDISCTHKMIFNATAQMFTQRQLTWFV